MNDYDASAQQNIEWRGELHKILDESDSATIFDWDEGAFAPVHKVMEEANDDIEILCRCAVILCRYFPGLLFAERAYERVLTLDPKNVTALKTFSWMAASHGDYERVAVYGERVIEIAGEQTAENYFIAARAHRLRGDIEICPSIVSRDHKSITDRFASAGRSMGGTTMKAARAIGRLGRRSGCRY